MGKDENHVFWVLQERKKHPTFANGFAGAQTTFPPPCRKDLQDMVTIQSHTLKQRENMKSTIVIYGSSTGACQAIAGTIASKLGVEAVDVTSIDNSTIAQHDNLILGTSTWGAGEMQDDWYDGVKVLKEAGLGGKTVALFGCGDSGSYSDTFCGGMKEIYDAALEAGANVVGSVPTDGYTFDDSEAVVDGKFVGLALDDVNEEDQTEPRIDAWLEAIKPAL